MAGNADLTVDPLCFINSVLFLSSSWLPFATTCLATHSRLDLYSNRGTMLHSHLLFDVLATSVPPIKSGISLLTSRITHTKHVCIPDHIPGRSRPQSFVLDVRPGICSYRTMESSQAASEPATKSTYLSAIEPHSFHQIMLSSDHGLKNKSLLKSPCKKEPLVSQSPHLDNGTITPTSLFPTEPTSPATPTIFFTIEHRVQTCSQTSTLPGYDQDRPEERHRGVRGGQGASAGRA